MKYYYVYELIDPRTNKVFYVGKGTGDRAYHHTKSVLNGNASENPHKDRKIANILDEGLTPRINFVYNDIEDEAYAYTLEESLQLKYGLDSLTNICIGNRPPINQWSTEERKIRSHRMLGNQLRKGLTFDDKWKEARSKKYTGSGNPNYGKTPSESTRYLNGTANRGKTKSEESKQKTRETLARTYQLTFPDGDVQIMKSYQLKQWIADNNHSEVWCYKCIRDGKLYKQIHIIRL